MKKIILLLIYTIFVVQWLGGFPPFIDLLSGHSYPLVTKLGFSSPISNNLALEDFTFLMLLIFVLFYISRRGDGKYISLYIFILNFMGIFFLVYSYFIKGGSNLFGDSRIFFISILSLSMLIAIQNKIELLKFHKLIFIISILELSYIIFDRTFGNSDFFGKNGYANVLILYFSILSVSVLKNYEIIKLKIYFYNLIEALVLICLLIIGYKAIYLSLIFFYVFYRRINKLKLIHKISILLLIFSILYARSDVLDYLISTYHSIFDPEGSTSARIYIWNLYIEKILTAPFLGHGIGDLNSGINIYFSDMTKNIGTVHNAFLTLIYEVGLIGFLGISMVTYSMINIFKKNDLSDNIAYKYTLGSFIGFILYENTIPLLPEFSYFYWGYVGLLLVGGKLAVNKTWQQK
jgi:hypothetical protein